MVPDGDHENFRTCTRFGTVPWAAPWYGCSDSRREEEEAEEEENMYICREEREQVGVSEPELMSPEYLPGVPTYGGL